MKDYMYLSPTPVGEDCAQLGIDNYREIAKKEMTAFINQLEREFTVCAENNVYFKILWQNHDFGTYGEVVAVYDDSDEESTHYALHIEHNIPENWDELALAELGIER